MVVLKFFGKILFVLFLAFLFYHWTTAANDNLSDPPEQFGEYPTQIEPTAQEVSMACKEPMPQTPREYKQLWDTVPVEQWGAADVSLSVPMSGRRVWLYGDTMSARENGFVHSTGIVQERGCLKVSRNGAQLIPNETDTLIHWIYEAERIENTRRIAVLSRAIRLTGEGAWAFEDAGFARRSIIRLEDTNNLTWLRWGDKLHIPAPDSGPLIDFDEPGPAGNFGYSIKRHRELPDGRILMTICQNWDDGVWHGWENYRPIFYTQGNEPWK